MSMDWLNYHHLHYFWLAAREGSIRRASEILHLSQPAISNQIHKLEQNLGGALFKRAGRGIELSDLGRTIFRYADEIFALGKELQGAAAGRPTGQPIPFTVGVCDSLAKLVVYRLLSPVLRMVEPVRLACREGAFAELLTGLAAFELDLVLSDAPVAAGTKVKAFNHLLGECGVTFFASRKLAKVYRARFPQSLDGAPILAPPVGTPLRRALDAWFDDQRLRPKIAGEFQDSALMKVFGQEGLGVFPVPSVVSREVSRQYAVVAVGQAEGVRERFYAVSVERRLKHPAVLEIAQSAKQKLFHG